MGRSKKRALPQTRARSRTGKRKNSVRLVLWDPRKCVFSQWESGRRVMQCKSDAGKVAARERRGGSSEEMKCRYSTSSQPKGIIASSLIFELASVNFSEVCAD